MSSWETTARQAKPVRRVREEVKEGIAVVATSALVSILMAVGVLLLSKLAG